MKDTEKYMKVEETISEVGVRAEDFGFCEALRRMEEYGFINEKTLAWFLELYDNGLLTVRYGTEEQRLDRIKDQKAIRRICRLFDIEYEGTEIEEDDDDEDEEG